MLFLGAELLWNLRRRRNDVIDRFALIGGAADGSVADRLNIPRKPYIRLRVMVDKIALITGVTGQDGAYLAELLLDKGYLVHGIKRRSSSFNTDRIDHLYQDQHEQNVRLTLHYGDMTDATNLIRVVQETQPTEIYNLAAQSHVQVSFETPEYTANADALGPLRLLEAIRILGMEKRTRFYQASTSELYGDVQRSTATRDNAVLSALALWRRQTLRLLDHGQLSRSLRDACIERHFVQS